MVLFLLWNPVNISSALGVWGDGKQAFWYFCKGVAVVTHYFQENWFKDAPFCLSGCLSVAAVLTM